MIKFAKYVGVVLGAIVLFFAGLFLMQNRFLLGIPFVDKGKTTSGDVSRLLGSEYIVRGDYVNPQDSTASKEFEREYLVHFGTFLFFGCHIEFQMTQQADGLTLGGPKGIVKSISWEKYMMPHYDYVSLALSTNHDHQDRNLLHSWYIWFFSIPSSW